MHPLLSDLTNARRRLRAAEDDVEHVEPFHKLALARATQRAIDAAGGEKGIGSNAEARNRALTIALADDAEYQERFTDYSGCLTRAAEARLAVAVAEDARREWEWQVRERTASAIEALAAGHMASNSDTPTDWHSVDDATDAAMATVTPVLAHASPAHLVEEDDAPF